MSRLIPAPLHRLAFRAAHALRKNWWRWRKPLLLGCRVLAFDAEGRVLLIRHSYGSGSWMLPGGGIARGKDPLDAALRELAEETACALDEAVLFAVVDEPLFGTTNRVHLVTGSARGAPLADGREVIAARFFAECALPPDLSQMVGRHLGEWLTAARAARLRPPGAD